MVLHRFTNSYRAADRVSQYLISNVIYHGNQDPDEVLFRILLFRFSNRVSTWELLRSVLGDLARATSALERYDQTLTEAVSRGEPIYVAYVIPSRWRSAQRKHTNHLLLLQQMLLNGLRYRLQASGSMSEAPLSGTA